MPNAKDLTRDLSKIQTSRQKSKRTLERKVVRASKIHERPLATDWAVYIAWGWAGLAVGFQFVIIWWVMN